jgi:hypothetical protein
VICNLIKFVLYFTIFFNFNFSLDVDRKVFMDRHGILALLRAVAATTPAEIWEVEEGGKGLVEKSGNKCETARK